MTDKPPAVATTPEVKSIILVSYPKIILLYPTFFASIVAAILTASSPSTTNTITIG